MRVRCRRDEKAGEWLVQTQDPENESWPAAHRWQRAQFVRLLDCAWVVEAAQKGRQARVVRAFVEGTVTELGFGECEVSEEPRSLAAPRRVRFEWHRSSQFLDEERQEVKASAAAELRADGTAWAGDGFE